MSKVRSITPLPPADFTPELGNYKPLQPFRYWCQKVLPLVYDDSLSYYELLCKVVDYLNKTMEDVETLHEDVNNLHTAYEELQEYINNYFSTLDVQEEINNKLDSMASDGTLSEIIKGIIGDNSTPIFVDSTSDMTNIKQIYVLTTNGHIFQYKGSKFVDTGMVYSSGTTYVQHGGVEANIDDATEPGSYQINTSSLEPYNLPLFDRTTLANYYWNCFTILPATAIGTDCEQFLIGNSTSDINLTLIFYRHQTKSNFSDFIRLNKDLSPYYIVKNTNTDIDNAIKPGTYPINSSSLEKYDLPLYDGTSEANYYWCCISIFPATQTHSDCAQILIGNNTGDINKMLVFYRHQVNGSFTGFIRLNEDLSMYYNVKETVTDIDEATKPGSYMITHESLEEYDLPLYSGTTMANYYWNCFTVLPSTAILTDCEQFLVGNHTDDINKTVVFYRRTTRGVFGDFTTLIKKENRNKVCLCGDSFLAQYPLDSYLNCETTTLAFSGASPETWFTRYENDITNDYDTYFVALGLNVDVGGIGTIESVDDNTFVGNMKKILEKILSVSPTSRIIIWCWDSWYDKTKSDLCKQLSEMYGCEYYSMKADANIPVRINGKFEGVMSTLLESVVSAKDTAFIGQNLHPNIAAQKMICTYLNKIL